MTKALGHVLKGLGGCGCAFVLFIIAFAVTGSYGFQHATAEGLAYVLWFVVGLGAPIVALVYLVKQLVAAAERRG